MFEWNARIYMDDKIKKNPKKYRKIVEQSEVLKHCYLLTLPLNEKNCLDIYSSREFWFRYYKEKDMKIVGMAASMESAEEILCQIVSDVYREYEDVSAEKVHRFFAG